MKKNLIQWFSLLLLVLGFSSFTQVQAGGAYRTCDQYQPDILHYKAREYQKVIDSAARAYGVSAELIKAVITAETCFRPRAVSHKGASGLMQLMPATARRFGATDRTNITQNIHAGTRYLRWLLERYNGSVYHAVAAYNSGEGTVDRHGLNVPYLETRVYVNRVINAYKKLMKSPAPAAYAQPAVNQDDNPQKAGRLLKAVSQEKVLTPKATERKLVSKVKEKKLLPSCMTASHALHKATYHHDKDGERTFYYTVKDKDSVGEIADRLGVSSIMIKRYNEIRRSIIKPGQKLKVSECRLK